MSNHSTSSPGEEFETLAKHTFGTEDVSPKLIAAIKEAERDPLLLHHLAVCKGDLEMLALLIDDQGSSGGIKATAMEDIAVAAKMLKSLARWARTGFKPVSDADYLRRVEICHTCPHMTIAPDTAIFRLSGTTGAHICGLCSCPIERKARIATESCPDRRSGRSGRWINN